ncbi:MAG: preprotein translocase subunit SecY [Aigarchaeota archaeon]|nr:preprotein translocase subunit SecY [Aigarchaeota archaeon]MDW8092929.1 preprotein translocase subunit SecY [Nitrososphaerota archaeon]
MSSTGLRSVLEGISKSLPQISKPGRKLSLGERLAWSAIAVAIYQAMSSIVLYGLPTGAQTQTNFLLSVIFASSIGTLTTLGVGPIVTAGLILQLLVGAQIIKLDLTKSEDRALFTSTSKFLSVIVAIFQAFAYIQAGFFGVLSPNVQALVFLQLVAATVVIIFLDELVQKGWGIGSGISLFIVSGVAVQVLDDLVSPVILQDGFYHGVILAIFQALTGGGDVNSLFVRHVAFRGDILGLISTFTLLALLVYIEGVRVNIPIAYAKVSGYRSTYPIKLLYVSNVPIIFASTVFQNIYYFSSIIWARFNSDNSNVFLNVLGTFKTVENAAPAPTGGLAYYVMGPANFVDASADPIRAVAFVFLMVGFSVLFAKFWVSIGGLAPEKVAEQLVSAGMQVPGFRRSPAVIAPVLRKYVNVVTIVGAVIIGVMASAANYLNVYGTGIGLLLTISILHQLYLTLVRQRLTEQYPAVAKLLGEA